MEKSQRTDLIRRMRQGEFIVSVQLDPPYSDGKTSIGRAVDDFCGVATQLFNAGVGFIDINSSKGKQDRIYVDSSFLALEVQKRAWGMRAIPHITTRDVSMASLLTLVNSAYIIGEVENFLIITGDPHNTNQKIPSQGVFECDALGAIQCLDQFLTCRGEIALAAAINQNDTAHESERVRQKIDAGADFLMSQTIFSKEQAEKLFDFASSNAAGVPLLVGVWPVTRKRTIEAIRDGRIAGVSLDDETFKGASELLDNDQELEQWGLERAAKVISFLRESSLVAGAYLVAPSHNPLLSIDILRMAKVLQRPA